MEKEKQINLPDIIKDRKILPLEIKKSIINNIFFNCLLFIIMIFITLIINISFNKLSIKSFDSYIDIIQIFCAIISVIVLEIAYRKDSGRIGIYGIELLLFSICILFVPDMYIFKNNINYLNNFLLIFLSYYIIKSFGNFIYTRYNYLKDNLSDVKEIVKEEKNGYLDEDSTKTIKQKKIDDEKRRKIKEQKLKKKISSKSEEMKK